MTNRPQILRSTVSTNLPTPGTRQSGELWLNFPDFNLGMIDLTKTAQKLLAVRFFATTATYAAGDVVVQGGIIYTANTSISPGAFNAGQWNKNAAIADIPAPYVLPKATTTTLGGVMVDGTTVLVDGTGKISSVGVIYMGAAPPGAPIAGNLWWDSIGGQLYVYYNDGNTSQWVVAVNENLAQNYLPLVGGTLTGNLTLTAPAPALLLNKTVAGNPNNINGYNNSSLRWFMQLGEGTAESGGNVGSDFVIASCDDSGTYNNTVMRAYRSNGSAQFGGIVTVPTLSVTGNAAIGGGGSFGTSLSAGQSLYPCYNTFPSWYLGASGGFHYHQRIPGYYETWNSSGGAWAWVANNIQVLNLDAGGNMIVHNNLTANGNFNTFAISASSVYSSGNVQAAATLYGAQAAVSNNNGIQYSNFSNYWYAFSHDSNALYVLVNGTNTRYILFTAGSDDRIKKDAKPSPYGLKEILATEPITFTYKNNHSFSEARDEAEKTELEAAVAPAPSEDESLHVGVSAQAQERIMPEMIGKRDGFIDGKKVDDLRSFVNHEWITYALVNAVKELAARVAQLEGAA